MILNVYKPKTWTSFDVVAKLRGVLKTKKMGHAGTLDPLAEGVLLILTEKDTKRQNELMNSVKEYKAKIAFGIESPTYDLEGPVTQTKAIPSKELVLQKLKNFMGEIDQQVPPYSAVKVDGKRLYKKARAGKIEQDELPVRKVHIHEIVVNSFENESIQLEGKPVKLPTLNCTITCSSGTYIRSIAHDLGGVLAGLVRTKVGEYKVEDSKTLESLSQP